MSNFRFCLPILLLAGVLNFLAFAETPGQPGPPIPNRLPYTFRNFVWWTDAQLRADLKRRIPGLGDELMSNSPREARVREVLTGLLKEKGVEAIVQTIDPSLNRFVGTQDRDIPPPAIEFSILAPPKILIEKLVLDSPPGDSTGLFNEEADHLKGQAYSTGSFWFYEKQIRDRLGQLGYLGSSVHLKAGLPHKQEDGYLVPLTALIDAGPRYHVAVVNADGGPLQKGKDFAPYFSLRAGDLAKPDAFGKLIGSLRSLYWQAGYADVAFNSEPQLDRTHGLASYHLEVIPGPLYHLRSIDFENLAPEQSTEARELLDLHEGEIYNSVEIGNLSRKLTQPESALKDYDFTYTVKRDHDSIDLTLSFFRR